MTMLSAESRPGRSQGGAMDILGIEVCALAWNDAIARLGSIVNAGSFRKVAFLNAHVGNTASSDPDFARLLRDYLVLPDGVGVDIAARIVHGRRFPANLNGTDFVPALLAAQTRPLKVGLIGATRRNVEGAVAALTRLAPQHRYILVADGFFQPADEESILLGLQSERPDVLLVAMGVPRQEFWIARNLDGRHCTLAIAVGALFDFLSGAVPRAPETMRRLRLEWLYRLWIEPSRLWRRYVLGNPVFLYRVGRQWLKTRRRGR